MILTGNMRIQSSATNKIQDSYSLKWWKFNYLVILALQFGGIDLWTSSLLVYILLQQTLAVRWGYVLQACWKWLNHSSKSTNKMQHFHKFISWLSNVAQHVLGVSPPIIGSLRLHWEPLVLPLAGSGWSVVGRGVAGSSRFLLTVEPEAPSAVVGSRWWAGRRPKHVELHLNVK